MRIRTGIILVLFSGGIAGCSSSPPPTAPTPLPLARSVPLSVTSIAPTVGSTEGLTEVKITGAGLGATVLFGGVAVNGRTDFRSPGAFVVFSTPAHAAGAVDVIVNGQNGESMTLTSAFTYVSPLMFDFNGTWSGFGRNGQDNLIRFTIENNRLLKVACSSITSDPDTIVTFEPTVPVIDGAFRFEDDHVSFSGQIVTPSSATGRIRLGPCASDGWYANRS
jgi:IPT/TIG domain-containing protein